MTRAAILVFVAATLGATIPGQQPPIQNGRVETRQTTALDREIATLASGATDPVWVGWRVPMVDGERNMCCWYSSDNYSTGVRGCLIDSSLTSARGIPQITPPSGPVPIEAGTGLVMLVRLIDHHVERLQTHGDDCPLDAGGRTIYWLTGVTAADSLKYLDTLTRTDDMGSLTISGRRSLADSAISAIGLHRDPGADAILDRIASSADDSALRRQAASSLGSARGAHGFATLRRLLETEKMPDVRRQLVTSLGGTRQPGTVEALRALTRDADARVRAEAIYWFAQRGGLQVASDVTAVINADTDDNVKRRAVSGLARLPNDQGVPSLIQLAANKSPVVRREAVTRLGESRDPRAVAYLEALIKK
jgi:hypothetical protein